MAIDIALVIDLIGVDHVQALFRQYAESLEVSLDFQDFENEVATLPGAYAAPGGALWLAKSENRYCGCVAVRPLDGATCELKRLFVRPEARGKAVGLALTQTAIAWARERGYRAMRLDTLPQMNRARVMYQSLGFREIPAYRYNPVVGTTFMELDLRAGSS